ncbi:AraC family transcriptional regulator [Blautia sp. MSJ-19]|uniref:AraC family transcriptional regulator n=1 Tax=Blautia sp. MSJ-19 TaxID=2841517 RepID=UPI001C0F3576|nr:AraC family transcriptional regulator [Blautia sp. MSJ-19]MBU5481096.1 AraC family transcriptional regulator [Blautia sp. MSJ-19]
MTKRNMLAESTGKMFSGQGTEDTPVTVDHDDFWSFEEKNVPVHWHEELEICLPEKGEAVYQIYQKKYVVKAGEGLLLNRNIPHSCNSPGNAHARYSTVFVKPEFLYEDTDDAPPYFCSFLQNAVLPCVFLTESDENEKEILQKLKQVEELFDQKTDGCEREGKELLREAFYMIFQEHQKELSRFVRVKRTELERLEIMLDYLHTCYAEGTSLRELSEQLYLSEEVCCRLFKKLTGKTITGYLAEYRANKSFPLVKSGEYSMTQIAEMVGFSNQSRFAFAFRKMFGFNPGKYHSSGHRE